MVILLLGYGKTGSIVAEVARERGHEVRVVRSSENVNASALTPESLSDVDVVVDFTTPQAVTNNVEACVRSGKEIVVGTTAWHSELPRIRELVQSAGTGLLYASNFSIGVNLFLEVARISAIALKHGYFGQIFERHHAHKKDAPSGTALSLQEIIHKASGAEVEITSFREGEVVGMHELVYESAEDDIYLCHDAKSRRGFALGAVRGAEWIRGKKGVYDFRDIWQRL
ncbi:MAG TPA: 4-hydroxy-tetrahydrodipicolinate reductase [Terriglobales bacterium]|nr:4-hydroxy-tetrahydrodipicolinate reductase [Terriglobales bacterium]